MDEVDLIPDEEFRACGFTGEARKYPLSDRAVEWLARFNGLPVQKVPRTWKFAPNSYMRTYLETKATET